MSTNKFIIAGLVAISLLMQPLEARKKKEPGKWQVEIGAGWAPAAAPDLNTYAPYQERYDQFFYLEQYQALHQLYGSDFTFTVSEGADNRTPRLETMMPLSIAIRRQLDSRFSLSLGLTYLGGSSSGGASTSYSLQESLPYSLNIFDYTKQDLERSIKLSASGWIPQVGIQYRLPLGSRYRFEVELGAGPFFASCAIASKSSTKLSFGDGSWYMPESNLKIQGHGVGIALSLGVRFVRRLSERLELFAATGYDLRRAGSIRGDAYQESRTSDSGSTILPAYTITTWSGVWRMGTSQYTREWGVMNQERPYLVESEYSSYYNSFVLDLSAFQLRLGLSLRL